MGSTVTVRPRSSKVCVGPLEPVATMSPESFTAATRTNSPNPVISDHVPPKKRYSAREPPEASTYPRLLTASGLTSLSPCGVPSSEMITFSGAIACRGAAVGPSDAVGSPWHAARERSEMTASCRLMEARVDMRRELLSSAGRVCLLSESQAHFHRAQIPTHC